MLGRLVARLRRTGLYDRALVVVTADHGISFRAGQKRRPLSDANLQDIAYVPLFVKLPHQRRGRIEGAPARTIDIVPTIADAIGVRIPWHVDGHSLLGPRPAERGVVLVKDGGKRFVVPAPELEARRERALRRQLRLFGSGEPISSLFAVGPGRERVNHSIEGRPLPARIDPIDRSSDPVQVSGLVPKSAQDIAVVVGRTHRRGLAGRRRPLLGARPPIPPGSWNPEDLSTGARSVSAPGAAATGRARRVPARRPRNERAPQLSGEAPLPLLTLYSGPRKAPSLVGGTPLVRGMIPRMGDSFLSL